MATLYTVLCAIQAQVSAVTQGLLSNSIDTAGKALTVEVGLYWPSAKSLQNNVRPANGPNGLGPSALVTIYDRGIASDTTRWAPYIVSETLIPATMTVTASEGFVQQNETMTVTFTGPVSIGDSVAIVLSPTLFTATSVMVTAVAGDTASTMAAKAADLLNANPRIAAMLSAVAVGPVVTLTSRSISEYVPIAVNTGNGGIQTTEVGRRKRHFQIVCWARTQDDRMTVGDKIEALIADMQSNFGLVFSDQSWGQMTFTGDTLHDEAVLSDTLRRDFMVCVDYGIVTTDVLYAVLAPIVQNTIF